MFSYERNNIPKLKEDLSKLPDSQLFSIALYSTYKMFEVCIGRPDWRSFEEMQEYEYHNNLLFYITSELNQREKGKDKMGGTGR